MEDTTVAEYDLLPTLVTKLDRHLIFPLLEFRRGQLENEDGVSKDEAKSRELLKATYELLNKTNMTDYVANLYCDLEGLQDPPKEFADKRQKVLETLEKYEETTGKIQELLGREDVVTNLRSDKVANLEFLKKEHDVRAAQAHLAHCEPATSLADGQTRRLAGCPRPRPTLSLSRNSQRTVVLRRWGCCRPPPPDKADIHAIHG